MSKRIKKISTMLLAGVMTVSMTIGSLTLINAKAATPVDEATITASKTLTINGKKFPDVKFFEFELEASEGYTNPNVSTKIDGQKITASNVPMPAGAENNKVKLSIGDFKDGDNSDTATSKVRSGSFGKIKYTTAGYYLYKLKELGSKKTSTSPTSTTVPGVYYDESTYWVVVYVVNNINEENNDTINGVHVESITAWHNEKGKDNNNMPNLKDIANHGKTNGDDDSGDNNGAASKSNNSYGQGQNTPSSNPPSNPADAQLQRWDDLGKVGLSTPNEGYNNPESPNYDPNNTKGDNRNVLDAYKFWNRQEMHNIALAKNVKGNLGDLTKEFEFIVSLEGLEPGNEYVVEKTNGTPTLTNTLSSDSNFAAIGTVADNSGNAGSVATGKFTANDQGKAKFVVKMSDNEKINLIDIPNSATYKITEDKSNHAPSYVITSSNNAAEKITKTTYAAVTGAEAKADNSNTTYYTSNDGSDVVVNDVSALDDNATVYVKNTGEVDNPIAPVIAKKSDNTNNEKETALATATETVNANDGDITVTYTNERNLETITGVPEMAIYFGITGLIAAIAFVAVRRRKDESLAEL